MLTHFFLHSRVRNWALKFGVDVWEFGRQFTNMINIKNVSIWNKVYIYVYVYATIAR